MMKVLVTGANGFLGYYLVQQLLQKNYTVIATGKGECRLPFRDNANFYYETLDFTDPFAVHDTFQQYAPDVVVHAGAMSKPDECEQNQWKAYLVNVEGTVTLLLNAEEHKSFFIFVSTDFVFDGATGMYSEDDLRAPVNFYGKTKVEGEDAVTEYSCDWAIVRTVMVYGKPAAGRGNLLTVVKEKLLNGEQYNVFDDQVRTPTYVEDLASGIVLIVDKKATGIFHLSGKDILTTYDMAFATAEFLELDTSLLKRVKAATFSQPAQRPLVTGLIVEKAEKILGFKTTTFREGLTKTFSE